MKVGKAVWGFGRKGVERGGLLVRKSVGVNIILECLLVTWNVIKICEYIILFIDIHHLPA